MGIFLLTGKKYIFDLAAGIIFTFNASPHTHKKKKEKKT